MVTQPITVLAPSEISSIDTHAQVGTDGKAVVTVVALAAAGSVYALPCQWSTSDPSVTLQTTVMAKLDAPPGEVAVFALNRPGTFTATCGLAGLMATVSLQR
jgi:hypothetical protein